MRRAAAAEFGDSLRSPSVQKYLSGGFSSPAAGAAAPAGGASGSRERASDAEARLQQVLASIRSKEERASSALAGTIGAYREPDGAASPTPPQVAPQPAAQQEQPGAGDALAADYRLQLQRYAQQLAAKDAEAAQLRRTVTELRQAAAAAESRVAHAAEQVACRDAAAGQLEQQAAVLERQLAEREAELAATQQQRRAAEQAAASARAQAAAVHKAADARAADFEEDRKYFQQQLERRDAELHSLEDAMRKQAAELAKHSSEWAAREVQLSAAHTRSHGGAAAARAELATAQDKLDAAAKRVRALEADNTELRRQKAQVAADMRMLEELLADGDAERRELHDKYVRLGERMEALVKEGKVLKSSASAEAGAARTAVQEALRDADAAVKERTALVARVRELQAKLEEEQAGRSALKDKVQRKLAAAEQEVLALRGELESKARALQGLQADMKGLQADAESKLATCEKQLLGCKERISGLSAELEAERGRAAKAKADGEALCEERCQLALQQQALKYERRIGELEAAACGGSGAAVASCASPGPRLGAGSSVLDYIPRAEHLRILEGRLAAKEGDMQLELASRVAQAEREWQWKLESKEQEVASLTARTRQLEDDLHTERQRATSAAHKAGDEAKRLAAQCLELQRELEAQGREVTRLKEALKDARSTHDNMDDDAMHSNRQVARLRNALEESQGALREAHAALAQERKRVEAAEREAESQAARAAEAARRADRLAGEGGELQAALEQKQELIAALQAESDAWSAKLMAHREHHEQEVAALRRQLREEGADQMAALEQQCAAQAAELREARQEHEEALGVLSQQHAAQVAQLETQLAAAERCAAELHELSAQLGSVRQEDVEVLKNAVQELQVRLKEAARERERQQRQHTAQLSAVASQLRTKMAALRARQAGQQGGLGPAPLTALPLSPGAAVDSADVAAACAECLASYEGALASAQQQLERQAAAAEAQQAEAAAVTSRLESGLRALLGALEAGLPGLPVATARDALLHGGSGGASAAAQQVAQAVQERVEQAEAAAVHAALLALEEQLLPAAPTSAPASPRKLLSPTKRQQAAEVPAAPPSMEANEQRLEALLGRAQGLLAQLASSEAAVAQLRQQVAALEAAASAATTQFAQAREEGRQAAEAARAAAVAPLQAEVTRLTERVNGLQKLHTSELAAIETSARQQAAAAQAEAQAALDRLSAAGAAVRRERDTEGARAEGLAADVARLQDELAKHTQRAASTIELQQQELGMLKERIREMEAREASLLRR
ncbi:hypothetical protein C2E21_2665 [Chlorella sorokiniana]|uniref:Uncharacterized protein n=1 Tax=Chlorella sorokiniana TaxID=3076 RepID=A0A2P6TXY5_CHLSO|nr:hypothetical protein C2E21_2665 [Chlorella sorokiniana]|eukprot:PRW58913.1 hypothetical protein C2E21_2665 [Chlorella sorokiniana]